MEILFPLFGILALLGLALWIWALVDAVRVPDDSMYRSGSKLIWVLVIVLTGWVGAIVYFVIGRPTSTSGTGSGSAPGAPPIPPAPPGSVPPPP
jgi:membrane-bound ClpP family serine protease